MTSDGGALLSGRLTSLKQAATRAKRPRRPSAGPASSNPSWEGMASPEKSASMRPGLAPREVGQVNFAGIQSVRMGSAAVSDAVGLITTCYSTFPSIIKHCYAAMPIPNHPRERKSKWLLERVCERRWLYQATETTG